MMNIVDIRNFYVDHNIKPILSLCDEEAEAASSSQPETCIYYSEEKKIDGVNCCFLIQYEIATGKEKIIHAESLGKGNVFTFTARYRDRFLLTAWTTERGLRQKSLLIKDGTLCESFTMPSTGRMVNMLPLSTDCFLGYFIADEQGSPEEIKLFSDYCTAKRKYLVFLYLPKEGKQFLVRDSVLQRLSPDNIHTYIHEGQKYLLLCDSEMEEETKRYHYLEDRSQWMDRPEANDSIMKIAVDQLIYEVSNEVSSLTFETLYHVSIEGYIRYIGMDENNIYYLTNFFPADTEKLCVSNKESGEISILQKYDRKGRTNAVSYLFDHYLKGYRVTAKEETYLVEGIWNSDISVEYQKKLGYPVTSLGNQFLISCFRQKNEEDIYFIQDIQSGKVQSVVGQICIINDVIIYYC